MYIEIINEEFDPWQKLIEYKRSQLKEKNNIGACSVFLGTMRDINSGDAIKSMELQHYPDMTCLLYTSPSPRDRTRSRMPSSA